MSNKVIRPFGLWDSPITPKSLAGGLRFSDVLWDSDGKSLVWLEERSDRGILVCAPLGEAPRDLTLDLSVRAQIGYGGGDFTVAGGTVYFVERSGRLYRQSLTTGPARPLTPEFGYAASPCVSPDGKWVLLVHSYEGNDSIAIVDAEGRFWPQKLIFGDDFYMQPRWHPDGQQIAWIAWNHPQMPWDGTRLCLARLQADGGQMPRVVEVETIAGDPNTAIFQPEFSPDGRSLVYISNETGWGNLYLYDLSRKTHRALTQEPVEIGTPAWLQGRRTYGFSPDGQTLYYIRNEGGLLRLWAYGLRARNAARVDSPLEEYTSLEQIALSPTRPVAAFIASSSVIPSRILTYDLERGGSVSVQRRSTTESVPAAELSGAQPISWKSAQGETLYGLFYAPVNPKFQGVGLPPAIIWVHGGPTSQSIAAYSPLQFFTTRGYAVLQVNYRGSTGYGKAYMEALRGNWGVYDVEDAISGARHLADAGLVDPGRLVILGGSAGGYTVLQALVNYPGFFKAGICLYGISNLFTLAADTHKFEARYLDSLLGPLPEASPIYRSRSPIFFTDRIRDPVAIFQGEVDRVVPKAQSDTIVESLRRRGVPHEYHVYEGEGHGWRKSETIEAFYKAVEVFLRNYVLFA